MQTLPNPTPSCKPPRAYFAHLDDQAGALTKLDGTIFFMASETGIITEIEPEHTPFLTVLGEIGLCDTQQLMDRMHGGAVGVCLSRQMEV